MGANRKRLADQMEGGEEQPPRSDKKNKSGRKKKDKKRGMKNKDGSEKTSKSNKDGSSSERGTSLETTATAEGKQMAQVLSTFSRLEQSRFEAFRKAAFHGDAIAKYVAHCLIHEQHRPVSAGNGSVNAVTTSTRVPGANSGPNDRDGKQKARFRNLRPNPHYQRRLVLSELVAPGQAQDITVVVSTLAKEYAQRLVLAARRHTAERLQNSEEESEAISPEDLLKAFSDRQARGLDPGFFLGGTKTKNATASETSLFLADPESHQRYSLSRSVALAAQDEYDKEQEEEEEDADEANEGDDDNEDAMKIDNDSEENIEMKAEAAKSGEEKANNEEDSDDDDDEEQEDPSEEAMRLFSLHVNRIIARQNGITVVTSDDEEEVKKEESNKKGETTTKLPAVRPNQGGKAKEEAKEGETKEEETKTSTHTPSTTIQDGVKEGQQKESNTTTTTEERTTEEPSSSQIKEGEKEDSTIDASDKRSESKETEEPAPMDTSDAQAPTEVVEGVDTSDGDVAMDTSPDNTDKQEEIQLDGVPTQTTESTNAPPQAASDTAATSETIEKPQEEAVVATSVPKADATTTASEEAPVPVEGLTPSGKQEQEIIAIDDDED